MRHPRTLASKADRGTNDHPAIAQHAGRWWRQRARLEQPLQGGLVKPWVPGRPDDRAFVTVPAAFTE